jgi:hypothetical protein
LVEKKKKGNIFVLVEKKKKGKEKGNGKEKGKAFRAVGFPCRRFAVP